MVQPAKTERYNERMTDCFFYGRDSPKEVASDQLPSHCKLGKRWSKARPAVAPQFQIYCSKGGIKMKYKGTLIAVKNMEKSKVFYKSVLELDVVIDAGVHVELTGGLFLQTVDTWVNFINKSDSGIVFSNNAMEVYFETDDMDGFIEKLKSCTDIKYIHPLIEHSWGQRAIRFYDLDNHIIEVAESLVMVIKKFIGSGLTIEQIAIRMDVDVNYVKSALEQRNGVSDSYEK